MGSRQILELAFIVFFFLNRMALFHLCEWSTSQRCFRCFSWRSPVVTESFGGWCGPWRPRMTLEATKKTCSVLEYDQMINFPQGHSIAIVDWVNIIQFKGIYDWLYPVFRGCPLDMFDPNMNCRWTCPFQWWMPLLPATQRIFAGPPHGWCCLQLTITIGIKVRRVRRTLMSSLAHFFGP